MIIYVTTKLKRTENHNFTITTNTSQHVEFFHSLIFSNIFVNFDIGNSLGKMKITIDLNGRLSHLCGEVTH